MRPKKLLQRIAAGNVYNVDFEDFLRLAYAFGYRTVRITGSHRILAHPRVPEILNVQPIRGSAKAYQIRDLLRYVQLYALRLKEDA